MYSMLITLIYVSIKIHGLRRGEIKTSLTYRFETLLARKHEASVSDSDKLGDQATKLYKMV